MPDGQKWQYFTQVFNVYASTEIDDMNYQLNQWGVLGWELVSLSRHDRIAHVALKRPLSDEAAAKVTEAAEGYTPPARGRYGLG